MRWNMNSSWGSHLQLLTVSACSETLYSAWGRSRKASARLTSPCKLSSAWFYHSFLNILREYLKYRNTLLLLHCPCRGLHYILSSWGSSSIATLVAPSSSLLLKLLTPTNCFWSLSSYWRSRRASRSFSIWGVAANGSHWSYIFLSQLDRDFTALSSIYYGKSWVELQFVFFLCLLLFHFHYKFIHHCSQQKHANQSPREYKFFICFLK